MTRVASVERWGQQLDWSVSESEWEERNWEQQGDTSLKAVREEEHGWWLGREVGLRGFFEDGRNNSTFVCCQP